MPNGHLIIFFDQLFLCRWLSVSWFDVAVVVDLRSAPKKEGNSTVVGGDFSEIDDI